MCGQVDVIQKDKRNLIVLCMLISSVGPVYIQNENLVIIVPADVLALHGARPSAGRIFTVHLHVLYDISVPVGYQSCPVIVMNQMMLVNMGHQISWNILVFWGLLRT